MRIYVINLDRSVERWRVINEQARQLGLQLTRVAAVDGSAKAENGWVDFDTSGFRRNNGRDALAGEYGCYMSHIAAVRQFINDGGNSALILEDDAILNSHLADCLSAMRNQFEPKSILIRLVVHRKIGFESLSTFEFSHNKTVNIGQCWLGPNGSAAAYWLTRDAALNLLKAALPAKMPFDTFIEHSWHFATPSFITSPLVMQVPAPPFSEINASKDPLKPMKYPWYRRGGALIFRSALFFKRLFYCALHRRIA